MKIYLLSFNDFLGTRDSVQQFLDTRSEIINWIGFLPHTICFTSNLTAGQLLPIFQNKYPGGWFMISEIVSSNSNGLLAKEVWEFINKVKQQPTYSPF